MATRTTTRRPFPRYDLFNPFPAPDARKDWAFELLLFWIRQSQKGGRIEDNYPAFCRYFGLQQTDTERKQTLTQAGLYSVRQLLEGGIIRDERALHYADFEQYATACKHHTQQYRKNQQKKWINESVARQIFTDIKLQSAASRLHFDLLEQAIAVVEEYYQDFTEKSVQQAMIQIRERHYGGDNRIGVMVKAEPYARQFTLHVRGIAGPYNVSNEGNGWHLEREPGSRLFCFTKRYTTLPSQAELIDDLCVLSFLESLTPKCLMRTDTKNIPIYPTAKEVFVNGYSVQHEGGPPQRYKTGRFGALIEPMDYATAVASVSTYWSKQK